MLTISELIREAKDRNGLSFRAMAEQAARAGHRVSHQYLQELATAGPKEWPRHAETIRGLAAAADTTEAVVVDAFARSFGLNIDAPGLADRIPPAADQLPKGVQDAITTLIWGLTKELAAAAGGDELLTRDEMRRRGMIQIAPPNEGREHK